MYERLTRIIDDMDKTSGPEVRELRQDIEQAIESLGLIRQNYMAILDERGVSDPWEAPVEQLDLEGTLALLSFIHRASTWRDFAYVEAIDSGLMKRILVRIRQLDTPASTGEAFPVGADVAVDLRWLGSLSSPAYQAISEWISGKELLEGTHDELGSKDARTFACAIGNTVGSALASYEGTDEEALVRILATTARLAYVQAICDRQTGAFSESGAQSMYYAMEKAQLADTEDVRRSFERIFFKSF